MRANPAFTAVLPLNLFIGVCSLSLASSLVFAQDTIVIEAEDFNFDGGHFIDEPTLGAGPDSYRGKGAELGVPLVDFRENTPSMRLGNEVDEGYRAPVVGSPGLPQTVVSADEERPAYTAAGVPEVELSATEPGEWVNYTRSFPAGDYQVNARVLAPVDQAAFIARLERVTSDPTQPDQSTTAVGVFLGRNVGDTWEDLPMTDVQGNQVTVSLDGTETLRLAVQTSTFSVNYLEFVRVDDAVPMPSITITSPVNGSAAEPGGDLDITAEVGDPDNAAGVQFLAILPDGSEETVDELFGPPFTTTWSGVPEGTLRLLGVVADTGGLVGLSSEVTVFADNTPPEILQARGRTIEDVVLTFSEALDPATASNAANYTVMSDDGTLDVLGASAAADGRVTLITAEQSVGAEYRITFTNLTDLAGNPIAGDAQITFFGNGPLLQTELGFVVFEAEHYDRNLDGLWVEDTMRGTPSGGVGMVIPNGAGGSEDETKLEYDIKFVKTGTHYFWYRAGGDTGNDDSAFLHLDGSRPPERSDGNLAAMVGFNGAVWEWNSNPFEGGGLMSFEITNPGVHTISIARREDGSFFDKFVITTDPGFDPLDFGEFGPPLTPREGEEGEMAADVEITEDPMDAAVDEHGMLVLTANASVTDGAFLVLQWQRQVDGAFVDIPDANMTTFSIDRVTLDWDGAVVRLQASTDGDTAISQEATITVTPETVSPSLVHVSGEAERINLQFSEPLAAGPAQEIANYSVSGPAGPLAISNVEFAANERGVFLTTDPQEVGAKYAVTVTGLTDQAATPNESVDGVGRFYSLGDYLAQGEDGLLVFEAEGYTNNTDGLWVEDSAWGTPSGGVSMVLPNGAGGNEDSKLEYELTFTQTGEHILWYRASGPVGEDDSGWLHVDGGRPSNRVDANLASMTGFSGTTDFVWRSNPQEGGGQMTFVIDSAGVHTIGLARREDGSYFDKFAITTDSTFNPESYGPFGPPVTREGVPPLPTMTISAPDTVAEGEDLTITPDISVTERVIAKVEYFADGESIGESTVSPFAFTWSGPPGGFYFITATLTDDVGDQVHSEGVSVTVEGGEEPPVGGVIWVNGVQSDAGQGFRDLIAAAGIPVTEVVVTAPTPQEVARLNTADLVIVSRKVDSGDFNNAIWDEQITAPLMLMSAYLSRANRWAWLEADDLVDLTPASIVAEVPEHPLFENVAVVAGETAPWHVAVDRGTSAPAPGIAVANGGTLLASGDGSILVAEWPEGAVAAGPRMLFLAGSREADGADIATAGAFDLTAEGEIAFMNAVRHLIGAQELMVEETNLEADAAAIVETANFGEDALVFSDRTHEHNGAAFDGAGVLAVAGANQIPLPSYLAGKSYVRFANDARDNPGYSAEVTASQPTHWYLLLDNRVNGPASDASSPNTTDPELGGSFQWVIDGGWQRVNTGISPNGQGDYTGVDEEGDGGLNQFYSVWTLPDARPGVTVSNNGTVGSNMISLVAGDPLPDGPEVSDADGDGVSDALEAIAGTDPNDPTSYLRVVSAAHAGGSVDVIWSAVEGKSYDVEYSPTLGPGSWMKINAAAIPAGPEGTASYSDTDAARLAEPLGFYRAVVLP